MPRRRGRADADAARPEAAEEAAREYDDIFERGDFFLEMQPNGLEEQEQVNGDLVELSKKTGIPLVATNDCHYVNKSDAHAHEILMCVQQSKTLKDEKRLQHRTTAFYMKSPAEMDAYFKHIPEAMENTARIAELCNVELELGKTYLPQVQGARGLRRSTRYVARGGARGPGAALRGGAPPRRQVRRRSSIAARLELELDVIKKMGFPGYFLIVWDFINYAKEQRHPGRPGPRLGRRLARRVLACASPTSIRSRTTCCSSAS